MAKLSPEQQQLIDLEKSLNLVPRRELNTKLDDVERDLRNLKQLFVSESFNFNNGKDGRFAYVRARNQVAGIIKRYWSE